ncbi:nucleotidyltransferase domain-containing protein [Paracoccaceae bacterium GXU_MW_L88]
MKGSDASRVLAACERESELQLKKMRKISASMFKDDPNYLIGVNGSVARRECTSGSDIDLFVLVNGRITISDARKAQKAYRSRLSDEGLVMPAHGGVFENPLKIKNLLETIGGDKDTNEFITRRMLFLLEGEWIFNQQLFEKTRTRLIERYVADELGDHKLSLFLLNDVIRYWRTICVDFEHKTASSDKPRAIRLIKLRFSRMLLYLGGVAAVSETKGLEVAKKRQRLEELFAMPTIARLQSIFGPAMQSPLARYARFLDHLNDIETRTQLKLPGEKGLETQVYQDLCDEARKFKEDLLKMLMDELGSKHDVVKALLL